MFQQEVSKLRRLGTSDLQHKKCHFGAGLSGSGLVLAEVNWFQTIRQYSGAPIVPDIVENGICVGCDTISEPNICVWL